MAPTFRIVIPARFAATRLPGKPLRMLAGKTLIEHVYLRARQSRAAEILIATDDERIRAAASGFGADACMTSPNHASGTDRLAEVAVQRQWADDDLIVNLQGDEPLMPPALLHQVAEALAANAAAGIATLCGAIQSEAELFDPNIVKVVRDARDFALYFSRAPIPWARTAFAQSNQRLPPEIAYWRHIGLYAYRVGVLKRFAALPPCAAEQAEALEQLRALHHGISIHVGEALEAPGQGVDTEADLQRTKEKIKYQ